MALNLAIETGASQSECLPTSYAELYTQCADPEKSYSSKEWMFMRWWAINQVGRKIGKASRKCFATFRKATRLPRETSIAGNQNKLVWIYALFFHHLTRTFFRLLRCRIIFYGSIYVAVLIS